MSASYDNSIKIWKEDAEEEWICRQTLHGHDSTVWAVDFVPDGTRMISCSDDRDVKVWSIHSDPQLQLTLHTTITGYHDRTIFYVHVSPEGLIATGLDAGRVDFG